MVDAQIEYIVTTQQSHLLGISKRNVMVSNVSTLKPQIDKG